jgi:hypothetical protein
VLEGVLSTSMPGVRAPYSMENCDPIREVLEKEYAVHFAQVLNGHRHERKCHRKNNNATGRIIMSLEE